jgi:DNA polymerase-3 subunit beta
VLVSKLIDGKFPDYERVVPATLKNHMKVGRQTLMQAMQRAAILTNEKFRGVRVVLGDNSLKLIAANAEQEEAVRKKSKSTTAATSSMSASMSATCSTC